jgi:hypothetical protein
LDRNIEDFHASFAYKFRVSLEIFLRNFFVLKKHLQRVSEPDAVHLELVANVHSNVTHRSTFQPIHAVPAHVCSRPVTSSQLDSSAFCVDYFDAFGGERELDVFDVEERDFSEEVQYELIVGCDYA